MVVPELLYSKVVSIVRSSRQRVILIYKVEWLVPLRDTNCRPVPESTVSHVVTMYKYTHVSRLYCVYM